MPKYFHEKFDFTIVESGIISSLPNIVYSVTVPFVGSIVKAENISKTLLYSLILILATHLCYFFLPDHLSMQWVTIMPLLVFGFGHAVYTTLLTPAVPPLIDNQVALLPICFSILKIT
jgi:hypothetical protein